MSGTYDQAGPEELPVPVTQGDDEPEAMEPEVVLDPRIQEAIGRSLKAHYDDLVSAPIPDRFLVLLAQLEAKERRNGE